MVPPSPGAVVLIRFPFSDLSQTKLRPAAVLANTGRTDWLLCQFTSGPYGDSQAISITDTDFRTGALRLPSYARPGRLFTASENLIVGHVGQLTMDALARLIDAVVTILRDAQTKAAV